MKKMGKQGNQEMFGKYRVVFRKYEKLGNKEIKEYGENGNTFKSLNFSQNCRTDVSMHTLHVLVLAQIGIVR